MKIAASSRTLVVALALAGSVGVGAALAASADTPAANQSGLLPAGTVGQPPGATPDPTVPSTAGISAGRRDSRVGLAEASRIAALVGHGRVTESEQEWTGTSLAYEMTVVAPTGAARKVTVDRGTGRVIANTPEDADEATGSADDTRPDSDDDASGRDAGDRDAGDRDGSDRDGHDRDGHDRDGHDRDGHDRQQRGHQESSAD
jgi:hypothetical protein